jgi:transcriptional regulator GlxA family with amidase domain
MLVDETRGHHHQLKSLDSEPNAGRHVSKAIALMRASMTDRLTIDDLAGRIGVGRRHLDRLFLVHCNLSAHDYWQKMKLEHFHWRVLNSDRPLSSLVDEVGMTSTSRMSKLFCEHFGKTPAMLRREFGLGDSSRRPSR